MNENFQRCLDLTLAYEGGYSDHPRDPGGATNFGVTRATLARVRGRAVSKAEVRALTRAEAGAIYRAEYWDAVGGDDLPFGVDAVVFDHAVNSGPAAALKTLRAALGLPLAAGASEILAACRRARPDALVREMCRRRMRFLRALRAFPTFGRGWTRRVDALEAAALAMAGARPGSAISPSASKGDPMPKYPEPAKPFWASQTIWSAVAAVGSSLAGALLAWRSGDVSALGAALAAAARGLGAIVGPVRAPGPIG